jgi:hypothetical protein
MPYKKVPKRFTIEMVHRITMLINSLPKQNGIHSILSPREIVTGKKFRCPSVKIGKSVQEQTEGSSSTDKERSIDALYIGCTNNGSGHIVFKLGTKQPVSVNRITPIPTTEAIIETVNNVGEQEGQPEGLQFSYINGNVTLQDFAENDNDEDSNASDDDFTLDEEYQEEVDNEVALDEEEGSVGNDDPDLQEDYFRTPIQQHNNNVNNSNEPASVVIPRSRRGHGPAPVVALNNTITPETQKCEKQKKKSNTEQDTVIEEDLVEDNAVTGEGTKPKVNTDDVKAADDDVNAKPSVPHELESDLGPYWTLAQSCHVYVLNTITSYSNIEASKSTPQYGFNRGLREFGELGYEATVKKLDDTSLGWEQ